MRKSVMLLASVVTTLFLASGVALAQVFTGGPNSDFIVATREADTIFGLGGNDSLKGLAGNDTIYGSVGQDLLVGSTGDDALYPGVDGFREAVRCGPGDDTVYMDEFDQNNSIIPLSCEHVVTITEDPPEADPTQ